MLEQKKRILFVCFWLFPGYLEIQLFGEK